MRNSCRSLTNSDECYDFTADIHANAWSAASRKSVGKLLRNTITYEEQKKYATSSIFGRRCTLQTQSCIIMHILSRYNDPYQTYLDLFGTYQGCKRFVWILFLCISTYLDQISPQLNLYSARWIVDQHFCLHGTICIFNYLPAYIPQFTLDIDIDLKNRRNMQPPPYLGEDARCKLKAAS
jgi:uncharacterized protein YerC